jgi:hypothetical protein
MATIIRFKSILGKATVSGLNFNNNVSYLFSSYSEYAGNGGATLDFNRERNTFKQLVLNDLRFNGALNSYTSAKIISSSSVTSRIGIQIIYNPVGTGGEYISKNNTTGISGYHSTPGGAASGWDQQDNFFYDVDEEMCLSGNVDLFNYAKSRVNPKTNHEWFAGENYCFVWTTKYIGPDGNYGRWVAPHTQRGTYLDVLYARWNEWYGAYCPCFDGSRTWSYTYDTGCGIGTWNYPAYFCSEWEWCYDCTRRGLMLNLYNEQPYGYSYEIESGRAEPVNTGGYWGSSGGCWG